MRNKNMQTPAATKGGTTLISAGTKVTGDIVFSGNLDVEGQVHGSISAEPGATALLRVVSGGHVEGEIRVPSAAISGSVKGDIYSAEQLELAKGAKVTGDVFYNLIEMAMGSSIDGGLKHTTASDTPEVTKLVPKTPAPGDVKDSTA